MGGIWWPGFVKEMDETEVTIGFWSEEEMYVFDDCLMIKIKA